MLALGCGLFLCLRMGFEERKMERGREVGVPWGELSVESTEQFSRFNSLTGREGERELSSSFNRW